MSYGLLNVQCCQHYVTIIILNKTLNSLEMKVARDFGLCIFISSIQGNCITSLVSLLKLTIDRLHRHIKTLYGKYMAYAITGYAS